MQIQFLGFQTKAAGRDYAYLVNAANSEPREFVFSIPAQAFAKGRIRYQEAASVCYQKLQRSLDEETVERPLPRHATVSDEELDEYREMHSPARRHTFGNPQRRSKNLHPQHPQRAVH
ncbi:MAG TPA: hypothetical protein VGZ29_05130 [Terriglobia bacterium]|nr:hypothetical protein [Terriglobia bacterium]